MGLEICAKYGICSHKLREALPATGLCRFEMGRAVGDGLQTYYKGKIEELELLIKDKGHNLRRLEAQRNELNASGDTDLSAHASKYPPDPIFIMLSPHA